MHTTFSKYQRYSGFWVLLGSILPILDLADCNEKMEGMRPADLLVPNAINHYLAMIVVCVCVVLSGSSRCSRSQLTGGGEQSVEAIE